MEHTVTEATIERLVRAFYARVRDDDVLGPIFAAAIPGDWEPHLQTMMAFWSSVMLKTGRFKGAPVQKHMALRALRAEHFAHWLALFRATAHEICPGAAAEDFIAKAENIADSLRRAISPPQMQPATRP